MEEDDGKCYECGFVLSEEDMDMDRCPRCLRHWHDDLEDSHYGEEE